MSLSGSTLAQRLVLLGDTGVGGASLNLVRLGVKAFLAASPAVPVAAMVLLGDVGSPGGADADYSTGVFGPYAKDLAVYPLFTLVGDREVGASAVASGEAWASLTMKFSC